MEAMEASTHASLDKAKEYMLYHLKMMLFISHTLSDPQFPKYIRDPKIFRMV
jgi:hypothetical protein